MLRKVIIIGFGLHAKRNYFSSIKKIRKNQEFELSAIVDIDSQKEEILSFFKNKPLTPKRFLFLDSSKRNDTTLCYEFENKLNILVNELKIDGAIIATEPKAHKAYLDWAIKNHISVLVDKPLTTPINSGNNLKAAEQIFIDYLEILKKSTIHHTSVSILSQRRYHSAYNFILTYLSDFIKKYQVPISYISIFHSDGQWNMPNEYLTRENHPYQYGYGKLMHSGYHLVDLFVLLSEVNQEIGVKSEKTEIFSNSFGPLDAINQLDCKKFFPDHFPDYQSNDLARLESCGELDSYSLIQEKCGKRVILTGSLNLLQNSFSRRAWPDLPIDTYKSNGRLRHETVNISVGPLLNIQVHSYESYESSKQKWPDKIRGKVGGDTHFDVMIFRNSGLVGGKSFKKISFGESSSHLGIDLMREARFNCIKDYIDNGFCYKSKLAQHHKTCMILSALYKNMAKSKMGEIPFSTIKN